MIKGIKAYFSYILCIALTASAIRIIDIEKVKKQKVQNEVPQEIVYTVKDYNGKIAVFERDESSPIEVFDTPLTNELPINDQKKLKEGIKAFSEKELTFLLQDYDN